MTKLFTLVFTLFVFSFSANAQSNKYIFAETSLKAFTVKGDVTPAAHFSGGLIFNRFSMGAQFQNTLSNLQPEGEQNPQVSYNMSFGSVFLEYNWMQRNSFSISTPVHIGVGVNRLKNDSGERVDGLIDDRFITIMPSIKGNLPINNKLDAFLQVGYRFMDRIETVRGLSNKQLRGFDVGLGLRFKIFNFSKSKASNAN